MNSEHISEPGVGMLIVRCSKTKNYLAVRTVREESDLLLGNIVSTVAPGHALDGGAARWTGEFEFVGDFICPYCERAALVFCGDCRRLSCSHAHIARSSCPWEGCRSLGHEDEARRGPVAGDLVVWDDAS